MPRNDAQRRSALLLVLALLTVACLGAVALLGARYKKEEAASDALNEELKNVREVWPRQEQEFRFRIEKLDAELVRTRADLDDASRERKNLQRRYNELLPVPEAQKKKIRELMLEAQQQQQELRRANGQIASHLI